MADPSSDNQLIQAVVGSSLPACSQFRITACNAAYIQGEFNATAQIDRIPGGPASIKGASIYAGPIIPGGMEYCEGTVGAPMDDPTGRTFDLPFSIATSSNAIKLSGPTEILVVIVVTMADNEKAQCVMSQKMTITPST